MEDDDLRIEQTVRDGQRNKEVVQLVRNWCRHAEIERSPGRGLIEEMYKVPIGHMGLQCKHVGGGSLHCWLLEDAAYEFYLENCKTCEKREPVGLPNITSFVGPREKAAAEREAKREADREKQQQERIKRQEQRDLVKSKSEIASVQLLEIVDELDAEGAPDSDSRLEEMARLAPEAFSPEIVEYLYEASMGPYVWWGKSAARSLLLYGIDSERMLSLCVNLLRGYSRDEIALSYILKRTNELSEAQVQTLLAPFVSMALPAPPSVTIGGRERELDAQPISCLYSSKRDQVTRYIEKAFDSSSLRDSQDAARALLAIDDEELFVSHIRTILTKLMRRKFLFPEESSRSDLVYYLRLASIEAFRGDPKEADRIIQSLLLDQNATGREEALGVYAGAMHHGHGQDVPRAEYQSIAFPRLLWAAVENPSGGFENNAAQFFRHLRSEFAWLAAEQMDALLGAAATLSEKLVAVDQPSVLERPTTGLEELEKSNQRAAINSLQGALIAWAAMGASARGKVGIKDFLELYDRLPSDQVQMRANIVAHFANLMSDVSNMQLVLSPLYRALMDEDAQIRASAANILHDTDYRISQHFPDLLFEAYAALLSDPMILVHKSAVRYMEAWLFPERLKPQIRSSIINLIMAYARDPGNGSFLVECIRLFVRSLCEKDEVSGRTGAALAEILETLEGAGLYDAVDKLFHLLLNAPGYIRVVLKSLRSDFTRSISTDDCLTALLRTPSSELTRHAEELLKTFHALEPFSPSSAQEGYVLITALTRAGRWEEASNCSQSMLKSVPQDERHKRYRLEVSSLAIATRFEAELAASSRKTDTASQWVEVVAELEKEVGRQAQLSRIPRSLFS